MPTSSAAEMPTELAAFHTEADKLRRAAAAYESVLVKGKSEQAMLAAIKEYGRLSPMTPTFIVEND